MQGKTPSSQNMTHYASKGSPTKLANNCISYTQSKINVSNKTSPVKSKDIPNQKYKTELCKSYSEMGYCRYFEKCRFAHGKNELAQKLHIHNYKQKKCDSFHKNGFCLYGSRCTYLHDDRNLENLLRSLKYKYFTKDEADFLPEKSLIFLSKNTEYFKYSVRQSKSRNRPSKERLNIFKEITAKGNFHDFSNFNEEKGVFDQGVFAKKQELNFSMEKNIFFEEEKVSADCFPKSFVLSTPINVGNKF